MDKPSQPQVLILGDVPKPKFWERALSAIGLIGGGVVGTYYGVKAFGTMVDVTKDGSWEGKGSEAPEPQKPSISELVSKEPVGGAKVVVDATSRFRKAPPADAVAASENTPVSPPSKTASVSSIADQRTKKQAEPSKAAPQPAKVKPNVISGKDTRSLMSGRMVSGVTYSRDSEGVISAKLHVLGDAPVHIPQVNAKKVPGLGELANGASHYESNLAEIEKTIPRVFEHALARRQQALINDSGGAMKLTWGALKELDGMGKFNVAGMALLGVALGGFIADITKTMVHGISHMGTASPDPHKQR